jgi:hypothetical protein
LLLLGAPLHALLAGVVIKLPPCLLLLGAPLHALLAGVVIKRALITSQGYIDDW